MAISSTQITDYLYKKVGFSVAKTDTSTAKYPFNESIASPLLTPGQYVWQQDYAIPNISSAPSANTVINGSTVVSVYNTSTSAVVQATVLTESISNETWSTGITNWIPPSFGSGYQLKLFAGPSGASAATAATYTQLPVAGVGYGGGDSWFFDYQSGIINFADSAVPAAVAGNVVYAMGSVYTGALGVTNYANLNITGNLTSTNGNIILTNGNVILTTGFFEGNILGGAATSGFAANANVAAYSTITPLTTSPNTFYPEFSNISIAGNSVTGVSTNLSFVPSTGTLSATVFAGAGGSLSNIIAANVAGTVTTANVALYSNILALTNNQAFYIPFANITTGNTSLGAVTTINVNPSTSTISALAFAGGSGSFTTVSASGITQITNPTQATNTTSGALQVTGGISTQANLYVGGNAKIVGNLEVDGTLTYLNTTTTLISGTEVVAGTLTANATTAATNTTSGALQVAGGAGIVGALYVGAGLQNTVIGNSTATSGTFTTVTVNSSAQNTGPSTGALQVPNGGAFISGNLYVGGNINISPTGGYNQITGNAGSFFGNTAGYGALYTGIPIGYVVDPLTVQQVTANFNNYAGIITGQNLNSGSQASADIFLSPNNGTFNDTYLDLGIASSTYNYAGYSLISPNDAYLFNWGNATTLGGNLILGTGYSNDIIFSVQGINTQNEVMRVTRANVVAIKSSNTATSTTTGALTVAGGAGIAGNLYVGGNISSGSFQGIIGNIAPNLAFFTTANATAVNAATIGNVNATIIGTTGNFTTINGTNINGATIGNTNATIVGTTGNFTTINGTNINGATIGNTNATIVGTTGNFATVNATNVNGATIGNTTTALVGSTANISTWANLTGTTPSTSTSTGALIVAGGVGIAGNTYVGGNIVTTGASGNISGVNSLLVSTVIANTVLGAYIGNSTTVLTGNGAGITNLSISSITGTYPTANVAIYTDVTNNTSGSTFYPILSGTSATANVQAQVNGSLSYVPNTGTLTATVFNGTGTSTIQTLQVNGQFSASGAVIAASSASSTSTGSGALQVQGGAGVTGNVYVGGNLVVSSTGYFGAALNYVPANAPMQIGFNANNYVQLSIQNTNAGTAASSDVAAIASNGSDNDTYVDMGIVGPNYNQPFYNLYRPNDGYIIVAGNTTTGGGNLILNTYQKNDIIFATGGTTTQFEVARITSGNVVVIKSTNNASPAANTGALQVWGGGSITGNAYVGGAAILNGSKTAGNDVIARGATDNTLIWARPNATYDTVIIGNSATSSTVVRGAKLLINSTDSILIPSGTTSQRPSGSGGTDTAGMIRFNTTSGQLEYYNGSTWNNASTSFTVISETQYVGDNSTVAFTLPSAATTASCIVSINGIVQIGGAGYAYTVSGTTLTFSQAPLTTDIIDVRILTTTTQVVGISSSSGFTSVSTSNDTTGIQLYTGTASTSLQYSVTPTGAWAVNRANTTIASANTVTVVDSFYANTYSSAEYTVTSTYNNVREISKIHVVVDGSMTYVYLSEYGVLNTASNVLINWTATMNGNVVQLNGNATNAGTVVRMTPTYMAV